MAGGAAQVMTNPIIASMHTGTSRDVWIHRLMRHSQPLIETKAAGIKARSLLCLGVCGGKPDLNCARLHRNGRALRELCVCMCTGVCMHVHRCYTHAVREMGDVGFHRGIHALCGLVWSCAASCGRVRPRVAVCGLVWPLEKMLPTPELEWG